MSAQALRRLLKEEQFIFMPAAYDALGSRLVEDTGFKAVYNGGFVTGGSRCTSEPLLTMDEQVRVAGDVANAVKIPTVADGGAGFGEPLHTMRSVREFIRAGVAGIHIEDQLYPKRAHYHKYVAHAVSREEFIDKKQARIPLVYVVSRGNRDERPLPNASELADMGYRACIDAVTYLLVSFHFAKKALQEIHRTGNYTGMSEQDNIDARQKIEDLIGLEEFYEVEEATVEEKQWGKR